jgi:hypothetical protein
MLSSKAKNQPSDLIELLKGWKNIADYLGIPPGHLRFASEPCA